MIGGYDRGDTGSSFAAFQLIFNEPGGKGGRIVVVVKGGRLVLVRVVVETDRLRSSLVLFKFRRRSEGMGGQNFTAHKSGLG